MGQDERERDGAAETVATEAPQDEAVDEVERLRAQAAEFEDRWKRAVAEFANFRRRSEQERSDFMRSANSTLIRDFLPVLDDLERALANLPGDEAAGKWAEGVQLVERKFRALLERQGVTPIEAVG